ncbi:MAG: hypothetical protein AVDCRST_MAG16-222, partial [uncultured Frankineae bacterium]
DRCAAARLHPLPRLLHAAVGARPLPRLRAAADRTRCRPPLGRRRRAAAARARPRRAARRAPRAPARPAHGRAGPGPGRPAAPLRAGLDRVGGSRWSSCRVDVAAGAEPAADRRRAAAGSSRSGLRGRDLRAARSDRPRAGPGGPHRRGGSGGGPCAGAG